MDHGQGWIDCNPASADGNNYDTWITENYRCTNDIRVDRNWKRLSEPTGPIFLGHNNKGQHFWLNSLLNNNQMSKDNGLSWTLSIPTHHDFEAVTGNVPSDMIHGTDRNGRVLGFKKMEARTYTTTGKTTLGGLMVSSDFGENWKFYPGTSGFEGYFPNKGEGLVTDYK